MNTFDNCNQVLSNVNKENAKKLNPLNSGFKNKSTRFSFFINEDVKSKLNNFSSNAFLARNKLAENTKNNNNFDNSKHTKKLKNILKEQSLFISEQNENHNDESSSKILNEKIYGHNNQDYNVKSFPKQTHNKVKFKKIKIYKGHVQKMNLLKI
ncbi:hypothetical protein EDEG_00678 [Edhazardia aedis USNM 41457]|uniref:Uncharacterized protein n=1 Tax=Edhazardia aedis (strain USNM 41457) TaxID=1003232 RepID=J8ZZZ1_EDHAE|nr:hypothetical protein EDEG_00678 [Edhazardia aedis USNM 41457]|eukprot:EJW05213.1 hypothetical protein EDEG_00678 [Edhazardia aedis USNM 41457]